MAKVKINGDEKDKKNGQEKADAAEEIINKAEETEAGADEVITEDGSAEEAAGEEAGGTDGNDSGEDKKNQSFFSKKKHKENSKHEKELESENEKLKADLNEEKTRYLRLLADFDNFKKRTVRENETRYLDSKADTLKTILPVLDAFERALKTEVPEESKQYTEGYEMIYGILSGILKDQGVEEIKALGEEFDPGLHNAVMHVEDENAGQNTIVEVFEKGYRMGDRILRFSIVKVAN
ncbi:MAG: nucleotide exchange factor GrpE [Clostridia bacterium]|nr:nucleotide exchange factor GrpE [Clostridia bacterium]